MANTDKLTRQLAVLLLRHPDARVVTFTAGRMVDVSYDPDDNTIYIYVTNEI